MTAQTALLFAGILSAGLMAGLLFGWAVSVIPGTSRISDRTYIATMQSINRAIINPVFVIFFVGTPVVLLAAGIAQFRAGDSRRGWLMVASASTYVVGVLGVTFGGNIPLNDALDSLDLDTDSAEQISAQRRDYETRWNRWHNLRTAGSVAALSLAAMAALATAQPE
jgi:uncharacterized membrane protein